MPFLDAGALAADPDGLAFLASTIASGGALSQPNPDAFVPKQAMFSARFDGRDGAAETASLQLEDLAEPA